MAGRKTKYTPEMASDIIKLLSSGCIVEDVCAKVGIHVSTYFDWLKRFPEFSQSVDRAKADANIGAVASLRKAMMPHDITSETVKTITETRLRKGRNEHGIVDEPFTYTKTERSHTLSNEFDWRAALEFLKRRDPDNWSEKLIIQVKPEHLEILKALGIKSPTEAWESYIGEATKAYAELKTERVQ